MLTLILNGSPHLHGDTASLVSALKESLTGEVAEINAYRARISPCVDCRCCRRQAACPIEDDMQEVYSLIERADNVVIASPVYFSELTGKLLDMASRLQLYYSCRHFAGITIPIKRPKRGAILLAGGGDGAPDTALTTARRLLRCMGADGGEPMCALSLRTDSLPASMDAQALEAARAIGRALAL